MSTHGHAVIRATRNVVYARLDRKRKKFEFGPLSRLTVWQAVKQARSWAWREGATSGEVHHNGVKTTF